MRLYGIVGAGGFGREVMPVAAEMLATANRDQEYELVFVVDHREATTVNGHRVMSQDEFFAGDQERHFNIAIADHHVRERIAGDFVARGAVPFSRPGSIARSVFLKHPGLQGERRMGA